MMRAGLLLKRSLTFYWRTNLAVIFGVAIAVAVLAGALIVGDSVRVSLRDLFLARLGRVDHVVSAANFFREQLASEIEASNGFAVCPLIVLDGSVTHEESKRRGTKVTVYGVDERFWKFNEKEAASGGGRAPREREILVSRALEEELGTKAGDTLLVRVEKPSLIPVESLHGRKEDVGRTIRLQKREALPANGLGEFSLRPNQGAVRAVFVPLALLQKNLEQTGKVNTLLLSEKTKRNPAAESSGDIQRILRDTVSLEDFGLKLRALETQGSIVIESESGLLSDPLAETARATANNSGMRPSPVLSYLANSIRTHEHEIPYSIVTAIDPVSLAGIGKERRADAGTRRRGDEELPVAASHLPSIFLNEWAARDLKVLPGEVLSLDYYLWQQDGRLLTQTAEFRFAGVVPIAGLAADRDLVPGYPGITKSESLSDWDPPFPVDLGRIRPQDEDYWKTYRTTPKAFIEIESGQKLWQSRFGKLTSLRVTPVEGSDLGSAFDSYSRALRLALDPAKMGFAVYPARAEGLTASRGATNFGEYFLYFSFFLIISALLLAILFFKLGVEQRLREIGTLRALGFPIGKIRALFLGEGAILASLGTLLGLVGALAYGKLMMTGLTTWWIGAVGTTMLDLHVGATTLALGGAGGIITALVCIAWTLRSLAKESPRGLLAGNVADTATRRRGDAATGSSLSPRRRVSPSPRLFSPFNAAVIFIVIGLLLLLLAWLDRIGQVAGFFGGGTLMLIAFLCFQGWWLRRYRRKLISGTGWWSVFRLGFRNATHHPGRSVLCIALIASAAFIVVTVDAFRREDGATLLDKKSGNGGFPLLAESVVPLVHDPNTPEGREALNLSPEALRGLSFSRFRVRDGDDASCLNLYEPRNPRILAPTPDFVGSNRFSFQESLAGTAEEKENPWLLLDREMADGKVPVIADANSMTYVLHRKLGDEIVLDQSGGQSPIRLVLVGALSDSLFQGELLMSEKHFLHLFPGEEGYSFFLLDAAAHEQWAPLTAIMEDRLSDFGFDVVPTAERLASFHLVENTFLSTFQMLGGLGLVLGTLGLAAVLLRNVLERRRELALLRAVGYNRAHFAVMVIAENAFLLGCGLITGTICALLAIAPVAFSRGGQIPVLSLGLLLLGVLASGLVASLLATVAALRSPLLAALRAD